MYSKKTKSITAKNLRKGIVRLHVVPVVVWLCTLAGVVFLFNTRIQRFEVIGMAHSNTWQVSAVQASRIKSLEVKLFDEVKKGQILVILDPENSELIEARLNTIKAEVVRLQAELDANRHILDVGAKNSGIDMATERRRFLVNVEEAKLAILELETIIEPDRILLKDYKTEIDIETDLRVTGATTSLYNILKAQAQYDTLARKIEKNIELLAQAKDNAAEAQKRKNEFFSMQPVYPSPDIALLAISKAIDVQQQLMKEVLVEGRVLVIESPVDGVVSQIIAKTGEVAAAELPILTISEINPTEVIAYASDSTHNRIKQGQRVELVKNGATPQIAQSQITQIGPAIDNLPERLQIRPDTPQWGRPFMVKIPPGMTLVPGEKVGIRGLHE